MQNLQKATLAAGCFWCYEAVFDMVKGISDVMPGYTGGKFKNPSYAFVSTGVTGHAEAVQITFDPEIINYVTILEIFWAIHDPTTLNRQGNDVGTQYRSAIFYHNDEQKKIAAESKQKQSESGEYSDPIVTEITELTEFYPAEDYHVDYYENNPNAGYCQVVISPKIEKFKQKFSEYLKD